MDRERARQTEGGRGRQTDRHAERGRGGKTRHTERHTDKTDIRESGVSVFGANPSARSTMSWRTIFFKIFISRGTRGTRGTPHAIDRYGASYSRDASLGITALSSPKDKGFIR